MAITVEELQGKIGQEIGVSPWLEVTQAMIDRFADAIEDHQFIHIDPVRAAQTPFGGTIAHGFLTLSLMSRLMEMTGLDDVPGVKMGVNYGGNKTRFLAPVRSGKRVRGRFKLLAIDEKRPGQWQQVTEYTLEIEGEDKPAVIAEWINQFFI
jgi:acyl dehydratase